MLSRWCYEPSATVIQQNPFSAFPERPASARQGGDRGEARHICHRVCERGPGSARSVPAGRGSCVTAPPPSPSFLTGAPLPPAGCLITKWLLWLRQGRTSLALRGVLRCLAGAGLPGWHNTGRRPCHFRSQGRAESAGAEKHQCIKLSEVGGMRG